MHIKILSHLYNSQKHFGMNHFNCQTMTVRRIKQGHYLAFVWLRFRKSCTLIFSHKNLQPNHNTFLGSRIKLPSRYHNPYATLMASFAHPCINCIYFLLSQLLENQLNGFWKINFISRQENMYKLLRKFSSGKYS